jgi:NADH-quinone oxidoreductase subunit J
VIIAFFLLGAIVVLGALGTVSLRNVFHAAMAMALCFFGLGGLYLLLSAEFLAVVQVLVYVGAIAVLLVFAVMLTRPDIAHTNLPNRQSVPAALIAAGALGLIVGAISTTTWRIGQGRMMTGPAQLGAALINKYALPFEVAGLILLVSLIGAILIAREEKTR